MIDFSPMRDGDVSFIDYAAQAKLGRPPCER